AREIERAVDHLEVHRDGVALVVARQRHREELAVAVGHHHRVGRARLVLVGGQRRRHGQRRRVRHRLDVDGQAGGVVGSGRGRAGGERRRVVGGGGKAQRVLTLVLGIGRVLQPGERGVHRALQSGEGEGGGARAGGGDAQAAEAGATGEAERAVLNRQRHRDGVVLIIRRQRHREVIVAAVGDGDGDVLVGADRAGHRKRRRLRHRLDVDGQAGGVVGSGRGRAGGERRRVVGGGGKAQRVLTLVLGIGRVLQPGERGVHRALQSGEGEGGGARAGGGDAQAAEAGATGEAERAVLNRQRHRDGVVLIIRRQRHREVIVAAVGDGDSDVLVGADRAGHRKRRRLRHRLDVDGQAGGVVGSGRGRAGGERRRVVGGGGKAQRVLTLVLGIGRVLQPGERGVHRALQ